MHTTIYLYYNTPSSRIFSSIKIKIIKTYRTKNQSKINRDLIRATNRLNDKFNHHRAKIKNSIKLLPENCRTNISHFTSILYICTGLLFIQNNIFWENNYMVHRNVLCYVESLYKTNKSTKIKINNTTQNTTKH